MIIRDIVSKAVEEQCLTEKMTEYSPERRKGTNPLPKKGGLRLCSAWCAEAQPGASAAGAEAVRGKASLVTL